MQILEKTAKRLRAKEHFLKLPELRKTKFEVLSPAKVRVVGKSMFWVDIQRGIRANRE